MMPVTFTPGTYLRKRRETANLTLEQAQQRLDDVLNRGRFLGVDMRARPIALRDEGATLSLIEADHAIADQRTLAILPLHVFAMSPTVYLMLSQGATPRLCRHCACSQFDACFVGEGTCAWREPNLCTAPACIATATKEFRRAS